MLYSVIVRCIYFLNNLASSLPVDLIKTVHAGVLQTPACLIEAVRKILRDVQKGKSPDSIATFTFCQQVTPQQYEDQREVATLQSLKGLLGDVVTGDHLTTRGRRRLLGDFQKHHPVVFLQHFSGAL